MSAPFPLNCTLTPQDKDIIFNIGHIDKNHPRALDLLRACEVLRMAGFDPAVVSIVAARIQKPDLPEYFTIINNRFLVVVEKPIFDLEKVEEVNLPDQPKMFGFVVWIGDSRIQ